MAGCHLFVRFAFFLSLFLSFFPSRPASVEWMGNVLTFFFFFFSLFFPHGRYIFRFPLRPGCVHSTHSHMCIDMYVLTYQHLPSLLPYS